MKTALDCAPCFVRQALEAARRVSGDPGFHRKVLDEVLDWIRRMDFDAPPPVMAQRIHRRLRRLTGVDDPYREAKDLQNRMALELLPRLTAEVRAAGDPLDLAARFAVAGNVVDLGAREQITPEDLLASVEAAAAEPLAGDFELFRKAVNNSERILYLADNAGEIVLDRLLLMELPRDRTLVAVRGGPVLNDATLMDARAAGIDRLVPVMENGSDAPGTLLGDCSPGFREAFESADLIIAKGQGNYETLADTPGGIFFLFKVKCGVVADRSGLPKDTHALIAQGADIP